MRKAAHPSGGMGHQIHAAGGASGSNTMVMLLVVLLAPYHIFYLRLLNKKNIYLT